MAPKKRNTPLIVLILSVMAIRTADAQTPIGVRASGLAEAFVGVADDATAVYWNPAGIATGAIVSLVASFGWDQTAPESPQTAAGERHTAGIVALSMPPIGLAYYRLGTYGTGAAQPAVTGADGREEVRRSVQALTTSTLAVSLLQSIGNHIVVSATPKVVRGRARQGESADRRAHDALDTAAELEGASGTAFDVDAGVMVAWYHVRLGLVARNLTTPSFKVTPAEFDEIELDKEVRIGGAWGSGWPGLSRVVVAIDGDLTSRVTPLGDRRDVAAGVETWWMNQRLGVRGGFRRSTEGDAREAFAAGVSAGVTTGMFVEAHFAHGRASERSWSVGGRMTF